MSKTFTIKRKVVIEEQVSYSKFIALNIERLRKERKLTQEGFAEKIGLSRASVVNIEKGRQQLSVKNLFAICEFFGIKSNELLPF